ncbi:MAG: Nif11-like leader peptide family RiPP precursor [Oscillospiraceae bacterium]
MKQSEEMKRLETELEKDENLRKALEENCRRIAESGEAKSDGEVMVKAAAELGFSITIEDLERAKAASEELSDDEMDKIAGGTSYEDDKGHDNSCFSLWHCFTITCHSETTTHQENCWSNYYEYCWSDYLCSQAYKCRAGILYNWED